MIEFNTHRFVRLAQWSLTNDKGAYMKSFLTILAMLSLWFITFTSNMLGFNGHNHWTCAYFAIVMFLSLLIIGPATTLPKINTKNARQTYLMLPASNLEKYVMRYISWIIRLLLATVAFFCADLLQYAVNAIGGNETVMFVTDKFSGMPAFNILGLRFVMMIVLWLHSFYALGGTFFRSQKYAWILTTLALIALSTLDNLFLHSTGFTTVEFDEAGTYEWIIFYSVLGSWTLLNFWLSYKVFCRMQIIGKFVNI